MSDVGCRRSDVGFTFGELRFASVRISDFGGKMSEVGCSKLEFRNWKLEIGNPYHTTRKMAASGTKTAICNQGLGKEGYP